MGLADEPARRATAGPERRNTPVRTAGTGCARGCSGAGRLQRCRHSLKHGENLLSAYAHNRESLVHEGEEISLGQVIGHMGEGAPGKPVLYFEIRRNGKPIDPLAFLPR
jgi:lipoprotein NlpD